MKNKYACAFAALLLFFMIAAVIFNSGYVKRTADHILEKLPDDISDSVSAIREIANFWDEQKSILALTQSEPELNSISILFDELIICAEENSIEEYKKTMARLKRAIVDLRELEEFSIENIF